MEPNQQTAEPGVTVNEDTFVIDTVDDLVSQPLITSSVFGPHGEVIHHRSQHPQPDIDEDDSMA